MLQLRLFVIVATTVISQGALDSQPFGAGGQRPPFRSGVDVIAMSVTVTDSARHYVSDLNREDFQILEDGRPQRVTFFHKGSLPLALALLIDTSASMESNLATAQEAAVGFVRELGPMDVASVIDFDTRVQVRQDYTADREALKSAIRHTSAGGSTALYNAVYIALKELLKTIRSEPLAESRRRAIVILSDGEDTSSLITFEEVLDLAARSERSTLLAYESDNARRDGQFRRIAVRVERSGAIARARPGYYAPAK